MRHFKLLLLVTCLPIFLQAQPSNNEHIKNTLDLIYDMNFDQAEESIKNYYQLYPEETSKYLLRTYFLRWKYSPIVESKEDIYTRYLQVIDSADQQSSKRLKKQPDNLAEAYYYMTAHIMRAELYALNGDMVKAAFEGKRTFSYIKKGSEWCEQNPEFCTTTGLYNYYIELYREKGFFYQTLLWPFSKGNKSKGLEYLQKASKEAVFTKVEAVLFLSHLNFKMEKNPKRGLDYIEQLREKYPGNLKFMEMHIENLIALDQNKKANNILVSFKSSNDPYISAKRQLFKGILTFAVYDDFEKASVQLHKAINQLSSLEGDQEHYLCLAYLYLAKLEMANNNNEKSEVYLNEAEDLVKYPYYEREIEVLKNGI